MENYTLVSFRENIPYKVDLGSPLFIDTETVNLYGKVRLIQLYQTHWPKVVVIDCKGGFIPDKLKELLFKAYLIGYNLPYDLKVLGLLGKKPGTWEDLYIASRIRWFKHRKMNLDKALELAVGFKPDSDKKRMQKSDWSGELSDEMIKYAVKDVFLLPGLLDSLWPVMTTQLYKLDKITAYIMNKEEENGLPFNKDKADQLKKELQTELNTLANRIPFNYNSSPQCTAYFGTQKADKDTLTALALKGNKVAELALKARDVSKTLNFITKYEKRSKEDGRVKGHFNVAGTVSGRMSCNNENIQQIPRKLKKLFAFSKSSDKVFVGMDFPQIELRLAVGIWGEATMYKLLKEGTDLHRYTASVIYKKPINEITKTERQVAKSANFGLLYGMGHLRFRDYVRTNAGIILTEEEAKKAREGFFSLYKDFTKKHKERGKELNRRGFYIGRTILGRNYYTEKFTDALNLEIQGSGGDLVKLTLYYLKIIIPEAKILNVVHDAIVCEATEGKEAEKVAKALLEAGIKAWSDISKTMKYKDIPLPLEVDIGKVYS